MKDFSVREAREFIRRKCARERAKNRLLFEKAWQDFDNIVALIIGNYNCPVFKPKKLEILGISNEQKNLFRTSFPFRTFFFSPPGLGIGHGLCNEALRRML